MRLESEVQRWWATSCKYKVLFKWKVINYLYRSLLDPMLSPHLNYQAHGLVSSKPNQSFPNKKELRWTNKKKHFGAKDLATTTQRSTNTIGKFEISSMKMTAKMRREFPTAFLLLFLVPVMIPVGEAVWLDVPPTGTKCVSEEIQSNVVVLADYLIISEDHEVMPTISVKVSVFDFLFLSSCLFSDLNLHFVLLDP